MSLEAPGVWQVGVWATTVYADGVWREGDAPEPPDVTPIQTPAGSSRKRRRAYVEIDGTKFEVKDSSEAIQLLQRARALAEREAEKAASTAESNVKRIAKRTGSIPELKVIAPEIRLSPELTADTKQIVSDINRLYAKAAQEAELRIRLAEQMAREDEEEAELMLLL